MKSVKELNKIADSAAKDAVGTIRAVTDELSFVEADRFIRLPAKALYAVLRRFLTFR